MTKEDAEKLIQEAKPYIGQFKRSFLREDIVLELSEFKGIRENLAIGDYDPLAVWVTSTGETYEEPLKETVSFFKAVRPSKN